MTDESKPGKDDKTGRFLPGNNGFGGRPKGSRNKLGEAFLEDMLHAWESRGPEAIEAVINTKPDAFLKVVAMLMPKEMNVNINQLEQVTDEQLLARMRKLDEQIRPFLAALPESGASGRAGKTTAH